MNKMLNFCPYGANGLKKKLEQPRGMVRGGRREEGSGWGTHVYLWWIRVDIWQNQYNKSKTSICQPTYKQSKKTEPQAHSLIVLHLEPLIKVNFLLRKEKKIGAMVLVSERDFWYPLNFNPNNKPHRTSPLLLISILKRNW